jgi:hypothetical protein
MKFFIIDYDNGKVIFGDFDSYNEALNFAERHSEGCSFTISEYDSVEDYFNNL